MKHHQKIQFKGMGDEMPNMEPGDINFIVEIKNHPVFKREGADLLMTKELSLNQAICGFSVSHHNNSIAFDLSFHLIVSDLLIVFLVFLLFTVQNYSSRWKTDLNQVSARRDHQARGWYC